MSTRSLPKWMGDSLITAAVMSRGGNVEDLPVVTDVIRRLGIAVRLEVLPGAPIIKRNPDCGRGPGHTAYLLESK